MIQIGETLVSRDLFDEHFVCDLSACKGACCVEGDAGAPLLKEEADLIEKDLAEILPFLPESGKEAIAAQGVSTADPYEPNALVTPLVQGKECAFTVFDENGVASCGIEKAYLAGKTSFRKPISCHLYPVRIQAYRKFEAINYHKWKICKPACACGVKLKVPLYKFLKDALVRKYGENWYKELEEIAVALKATEKNRNKK